MNNKIKLTISLFFLVYMIYFIKKNKKILFVGRIKKNTIYGLYDIGHIKIIDTVDDLIDIVKTKKKIRIVGEGWSWNNCALSENTLKLGKEFKKIQIYDGYIELGAGLNVSSVIPELIKKNKQLKSVGACISTDMAQTIGGLIATNVHHSGYDLLPFSESCLEVTILHWEKSLKTGENELVFKKYKREDKYFKYFFGTIGTLGIIVSAKFEIENICRYQSKLYTSEKTDDIFLNNLNMNPLITSLPYEKKWVHQSIIKLNEDVHFKKYDKNVVGINSFKIFGIRFLWTLLLYIIPEKMRNYKLIRGNYFIKFFKKTENISNFENIWDIGHTGLLCHSTLTIGFYVPLKNFVEIIEIIEENKIRDNYFISIRFVPKLKNCLFTLNSDLIDIEFAKATIDKSKTNKIVNDFFIYFENILKKKNIKYYTHPGKFNRNGWKFKNIFPKQIIQKYEYFRNKNDPYNQFVSIYN